MKRWAAGIAIGLLLVLSAYGLFSLATGTWPDLRNLDITIRIRTATPTPSVLHYAVTVGTWSFSADQTVPYMQVHGTVQNNTDREISVVNIKLNTTDRSAQTVSTYDRVPGSSCLGPRENRLFDFQVDRQPGEAFLHIGGVDYEYP